MTGRTGLLSSNVKVRGYPIQEKAISPTKLLEGGKACLIVGASGGPIPGQNYYGGIKVKGLSNWSLERPAGNVLDFNKN